MIRFLFFKIRRANHSFLRFLINLRRWSLPRHMLNILRVKLMGILILILRKQLLSFQKIMLGVLRNLIFRDVKNLQKRFITLSRHFWIIHNALIQKLSVVRLSSVEYIMDRWLLFLDEVYLVGSLCSAHWVLWVDFSLLEGACCFCWGVRGWDTEVGVDVFFFRGVFMVFVWLLRSVEIGADFVFYWLASEYVLWRVFLLGLLSLVWLALKPSIHLISSLNRAFRRRRWCFSVWWSLSMRHKNLLILLLSLLSRILSLISLLSSCRRPPHFTCFLIYWFTSVFCLIPLL